MTVDRICSLIDGKLVVPGKACEIVGFYAGDFLSHVMLKSLTGYALLTVIDHINVAVIATKVGIEAIILCDGVKPTDRLIWACEQKGIALITAKLNTFDCAALLGNCIK